MNICFSIAMSQVTSAIPDQEQKRNTVKVPFAIIPLPNEEKEVVEAQRVGK